MGGCIWALFSYLVFYFILFPARHWDKCSTPKKRKATEEENIQVNKAKWQKMMEEAKKKKELKAAEATLDDSFEDLDLVGEGDGVEILGSGHDGFAPGNQAGQSENISG